MNQSMRYIMLTGIFSALCYTGMLVAAPDSCGKREKKVAKCSELNRKICHTAYQYSTDIGDKGAYIRCKWSQVGVRMGVCAPIGRLCKRLNIRPSKNVKKIKKDIMKQGKF